MDPIRISVKVIPRAGRNNILKAPDDSLKVYVSQPPDENRANKAVIELLAEYYGVAKSGIRIISGVKSRNKIIELGG